MKKSKKFVKKKDTLRSDRILEGFGKNINKVAL